MVVIFVPMSNKFKIFFTFEDNKTHAVDYRLNDTLIAKKWFGKIKHLRNVAVDKTISDLDDVSDLAGLYKQFCEFAGIGHFPFETVDQELCNRLHEIYEKEHDRISRMADNAILYKFHQAIHNSEDKKSNKPKKYITVGWGVKEGPLTHRFNCGDFNEPSIVRNNLYLEWSELGKTPLRYWRDKEPNDQNRFNELARPHITFRAKFAIALQDSQPSELDPAFIEWFDQYKQNWLEHHGVQKWDKIDEYCSPLLASTDDKIDLTTARFHSIAQAD
jgi:hypothetical protein